MIRKVLVLYIPVLHQGYLQLFEKYSQEVEGLYILGESLVEECKYLEREIRAIAPSMALRIVEAAGYFRKVEILESCSLEVLEGCSVITANEGITRRFAEKYLDCNKVSYDSSFLRWDESHVISRTDTRYDRESQFLFDKEMMRLAIDEGKKSPDWWRQVGAVVVTKDGTMRKAHNKDPVSEYRLYTFGNIRDFVKAGEKNEATPTIHAEQVLIAKAASGEFSLKGAHIYVSTFPCPTCANLIAESGIEKCFFAFGTAYLDSEATLKARGVEVVLVK
jgi:dCMP deaminase